jgi:hypothetical protein
MQITINQAEIEDAIRTFVRSQLPALGKVQIVIDLRATRGADGTTAVIELVQVKQDEVTIQQVVAKVVEPTVSVSGFNAHVRPSVVEQMPTLAPVQFTPAEIEKITAPEPKLTVDEAIATIPPVDSEAPVAPRVRNLFGGMTAP